MRLLSEYQPNFYPMYRGDWAGFTPIQSPYLRLKGSMKTHTEQIQTMVGLLKLCEKYLDHPDVVSLNFALSSGVVANRIRMTLDEVGVDAEAWLYQTKKTDTL
jgi:hypothetical protein